MKSRPQHLAPGTEECFCRHSGRRGIFNLSPSCDTWLAWGDITADGSVIFGKNSDRPPFESQTLVYNERKDWQPGSNLKVEYVLIPQVEETYATLGVSPYWCWGYEMGVNEHGVVIGNEALYTRRLKEIKRRNELRGLTGMDLVRLGLERAKSTFEAVEVITGLIREYGQWGSAIPTKNDNEGSYDNSFLIADSGGAWVVEAYGKEWVAKRIARSFASISNAPVIGAEWEISSEDIREEFPAKRWWPRILKNHLRFNLAVTDWLNHVSISGEIRKIKSTGVLKSYVEEEKKLTTEDFFSIAREHGLLSGMCMHQKPPICEWETTSSMIVVLPKDKRDIIEVWWAAGKPCRSVYVPFFFESEGIASGVSETGKVGRLVTHPESVTKDSFSDDSYWWLIQKHGNAGLKDLEEHFLKRAKEAKKEVVKLFSEEKFEEARNKLSDLTDDCISAVLDGLKSGEGESE